MNKILLFAIIALQCPIIWLIFQYVLDTQDELTVDGYDIDLRRNDLPIITKSVKTEQSMSEISHSTLIEEVINSNFIINEKHLCGEAIDPIDLLIVVHSAPTNFMNRQTIRETWGAIYQEVQLENVKFVFLLGLSKDKDYNEDIRKESRENRDIIQCGFIDVYQNLTLKSICMLRWVTNFCSNSNLLFKTDDDMYINVENLLNIAGGLPRTSLIFGLLFKNANPIRDPNHKHYVPYTLYPKHFYPDYVRGTAYGITGDVVPKLLDACRKVDYINMEDIFVTGICAEAIGVQRLNATGFPHFRIKSSLCGYRTNVAGHKVNIHEMRRIYRYIKDPLIKCDVLI